MSISQREPVGCVIKLGPQPTVHPMALFAGSGELGGEVIGRLGLLVVLGVA